MFSVRRRLAAERIPYARRVHAVERFDELVDSWFDQLRGNNPIDRVMYGLSEVADFSVLWHLLGTAQGLTRADGFRRAARLSATLGVESALVNGAIKSLFRRHRPVSEFERPHQLRIPKTSSFPSGHASAAFVAAALLADDSRAGALYYALATMVAASRIHVRIHHASDVIGGIVIGATIGAAVKRFFPL